MATAGLITAQDFDKCMVECFTTMGKETREFVINTIQVNINELINSGRFDLNHYKQVIDQLVIMLDGDDTKEGFQQFIQLINDVKLLKQEHITQQEITNIVQRMFVAGTVEINNNFVSTVVRNENFINEIKNSTTVISVMVNNTMTSIINYLSQTPPSTPDAMRDQFVSILNQFISHQVTQVSNNFSNQVVQVKNEITNQFNVSIESIQANITRLNNELIRINTWVNGCSTKDELANIRKEIEVFNSLRIQFIKLQSDVGDLLKRISTDSNFFSTINLSQNTTIVNISSQLTTISNNILEINGKISQLTEFVSKKDLANACAAACDAFIKTLTKS
ncbi:MAG: hypothetical protein BWK79_11655 [Beggiatoa sp. IS2]|nr:MAG: hypothetical protein BWK79_11655 [Beggiatoa sp. IS2]